MSTDVWVTFQLGDQDPREVLKRFATDMEKAGFYYNKDSMGIAGFYSKCADYQEVEGATGDSSMLPERVKELCSRMEGTGYLASLELSGDIGKLGSLSFRIGRGADGGVSASISVSGRNLIGAGEGGDLIDVSKRVYNLVRPVRVHEAIVHDYDENYREDHLFWLNFFGPGLVGKIGKKRMLSLKDKVYLVEEMPDGGMMIVLDKDFRNAPFETARQVARKLGMTYFKEHDLAEYYKRSLKTRIRKKLLRPPRS